MTPEFLEAYAAALNRATDIMGKMQSKGILQEGVDDQLMRDFDQSQAEVKRFNDQIIAMNQQNR